MRSSRILLALLGVLALPAPAQALTVTQLPRSSGCFQYEGYGGCTDSSGTEGTAAAAVSPDGRNVYAGQPDAHHRRRSLSTFALAEDGRIQGRGTCVLLLRKAGDRLCKGAPRTKHLFPVQTMAMIDDGKSLYATSSFEYPDQLQAYRVDPQTGRPSLEACAGAAATGARAARPAGSAIPPTWRSHREARASTRPPTASW